MLTNYDFLIRKLRYFKPFINYKAPATPLKNIFFKFILQFENYWMIINADPI